MATLTLTIVGVGPNQNTVDASGTRTDSVNVVENQPVGTVLGVIKGFGAGEILADIDFKAKTPDLINGVAGDDSGRYGIMQAASNGPGYVAGDWIVYIKTAKDFDYENPFGDDFDVFQKIDFQVAAKPGKTLKNQYDDPVFLFPLADVNEAPTNLDFTPQTALQAGQGANLDVLTVSGGLNTFEGGYDPDTQNDAWDDNEYVFQGATSEDATYSYLGEFKIEKSTGKITTAGTLTSGTKTLNVTVRDKADPSNTKLQYTESVDVTVTAVAAPTVSIAALSASKAEGSSGSTQFTFEVTRTGDLSSGSTVNWNFSGSGANAADANDVGATSGSVIFANGETSKTITVSVNGDTTVEHNEGFTVTLTGSQNATIGTGTANGTITNDDAPPGAPTVSITADNELKAEGNSGTTPFTFTVVRDSGVGTSTVGWTLTGSTDAADITSSSGLVSFGANETSKTITVLVNGDTMVENNETFTVTLNSVDNATVDPASASASSTILNDDLSQSTPSVFDIVMKDAIKYEGDSGTSQFTFTISRASTVGGASVRWRFLGDGEDPASRSDVKDYEGLAIFDNGQGSKDITVEIKGDITNENDEYFSVILMSADGATIGKSIADGVIRDDDNSPTDISLTAPNLLNPPGARELAASGLVVGTLSATDPDLNSSFTYTLLDSAGGRFKLDASGTQLLVDNGFLLDFEQAKSHKVKVQVNDGSGHTFVKELTVAVTDWTAEVTAGSTATNIFKGGAGIDKLAGNAGHDKLYGGGGNDVLTGGIGNDYLWGGAGKDVLTGNTGKDFFVFDSFNAKTNKRTNVDAIKDFKVKDDSIYLDNAVFKALGKAGALTKPAKMKKDAFWIGSAAHDKDDRIIYDNKKGILYYDADGSGKGAAVQIATLSKKLLMTEKDFFVI